MNEITVKDGRKRLFAQVEFAIIDDTEFLKWHDKLIYLAICRFANFNTKEGFPSIDKLSACCDVSANTVRKALKNLEAHGLIEVERKQHRPNIYTITDVPDKFYRTSPGEGLQEVRTSPGEGLHDMKGRTSPGEGLGVQEVKGSPSPGEPERDTFKEIHLKKDIERDKAATEQAAAADHSQLYNLLWTMTSGRINELLVQQINEWIEEGFEEASLCLAFEKAMAVGKDFPYSKGIINQWRKKKLFTYEQCSSEGKKKQPEKKAVGGSNEIPGELLPHEIRVLELMRKGTKIAGFEHLEKFL